MSGLTGIAHFSRGNKVPVMGRKTIRINLMRKASKTNCF